MLTGRRLGRGVAIKILPAVFTSDLERLARFEREATGPFDTTQDMNYDVFPDGQHFVLVEADPDARPTRLQVVLNWSEELKRRETVSSSGEGGLR